jgi:hypothetical protein
LQSCRGDVLQLLCKCPIPWDAWSAAAGTSALGKPRHEVFDSCLRSFLEHKAVQPAPPALTGTPQEATEAVLQSVRVSQQLHEHGIMQPACAAGDIYSYHVIHCSIVEQK